MSSRYVDLGDGIFAVRTETFPGIHHDNSYADRRLGTGQCPRCKTGVMVQRTLTVLFCRKCGGELKSGRALYSK